jgi:putative nucleotidyltransferase-like protein
MARDLRASPSTAVADWAADFPASRSLHGLQLALRKVTERLASELRSPTAIAPQWCAIEWAVARAVAAIHGVSPLLADSLRWQGPPEWRQFLAAQKAQTAQRFRRIEQLLGLLDARARAADLALVPLKGAALHAAGIYVAGERPMADVDLLVRDEQTQCAVAVLGQLGLHEVHRSCRHRVFAHDGDRAPAALGEHAENGIKVELHCRIAEVLPRRAVDITQLIFPQPLRPGLNPYPSRAALMAHLLLHAAGNLVRRGLRLLQLHDIARLSAQMTDEDWEELSQQARRTTDRSLWWAFPPLALAGRYCSHLPEQSLARAADDCHWWLKRVYPRRDLSDASLSHLWVSAFPGIEWARSPAEAFGYAAARLLPGPTLTHARKTLARLQPRVSGGTWAELSQARRMLRWLFCGEARHETLQPVRAALLPGKQ